MYLDNSLITDSGCLNTHKFTPIRLNASTVSYMDSPFLIDELATSKSTTVHPRFFAAISNEDFVLVLGSQKIFAIVLSGNNDSRLKVPSEFLNFLAQRTS